MGESVIFKAGDEYAGICWWFFYERLETATNPNLLDFHGPLVHFILLLRLGQSQFIRWKEARSWADVLDRGTKKKRQLQYQPGETMNNHEPIRQMWMVGSRQDTNENHWEPSSCSAYPLQTRDFDCYKHSWPLFRSFPSNSVKYFLLDISRFAAVFQRSILSHVSGSSGFISQRSLLWKCWKCHDFTSCILWRPVGWNGGQHRFSHA